MKGNLEKSEPLSVGEHGDFEHKMEVVNVAFLTWPLLDGTMYSVGTLYKLHHLQPSSTLHPTEHQITGSNKRGGVYVGVPWELGGEAEDGDVVGIRRNPLMNSEAQFQKEEEVLGAGVSKEVKHLPTCTTILKNRVKGRTVEYNM